MTKEKPKRWTCFMCGENIDDNEMCKCLRDYKETPQKEKPIKRLLSPELKKFLKYGVKQREETPPSLSDEIGEATFRYNGHYTDMILAKKVKEFVRRIKYMIQNGDHHLCDEIDKLAGEKLT